MKTNSITQAAEDHIVHLFEDTNLCAIHAKRVTISMSLLFNPFYYVKVKVFLSGWLTNLMLFKISLHKAFF